MSTALDLRLVPKVLSIIDRYGTTVTFKEPVGQVNDPKTGTVTVASVTSHSAKVTPPAPYDVRMVDGDLIRRDDCKVILAAQGLAWVPTLTWSVQIGSETWTIVAVSPLRTGDDVAAYEIQLRR